MRSKRFWKKSFQWLAVVLLVPALLTAIFFHREIKQQLTYPMDYSEEAQGAESSLVSFALLMAVIRTESGFDPNAISRAGARGLTQIMPDTFAWLQTKTGEDLDLDALFDPKVSIRYGALFLDLLLGEFGETETALAAYHAGRSRVNGWLRDPQLSPDGATLAHIPVSQTRHYVRKVMKAYERYDKICG